MFLDNTHEDMKKVLDARAERALASSDAIVAGDLWTDQSMTSICNLFIFTPNPLYVDTCVWGEERHSAVNTAASFKKRIDALGSCNVIAFVSDTEPKMLAVWEILERDYPTMIMLPCAANCLDLTLEDICKYEDFRSALELCTDTTQFWRHRYLPRPSWNGASWASTETSCSWRILERLGGSRRCRPQCRCSRLNAPWRRLWWTAT